jgi:hypothetical protein
MQKLVTCWHACGQFDRCEESDKAGQKVAKMH